MATIDIHNLSGEKVGTLDLADEIFGAVNEDLLWEAVKHYRAAQRAGTHATKNKKLVSGAGKKLWKQKGTGRARVGSIRSPLWRHGGTVHGPQPRSYDYAFPRKKLLGALRSALASKLADGKLVVVNAFDVKEPKSKLFRQALDALEVEEHSLAGRSGPARQSQPGAEFAQPGRGRTGERQRSPSLPSVALRSRDFLAAGDRGAAAFAEELDFEAAAQRDRERKHEEGHARSAAPGAS